MVPGSGDGKAPNDVASSLLSGPFIPAAVGLAAAVFLFC